MTTGGARWRLLVTAAADGPTNMAIDEALWQGRRAGTSPPTLRCFGWAPPTVSLGYGQPLDRAVDAGACRRLGVGLVRRPTGGSAIYHDGPERELTYAVTAAAADLGVSADLLETYQWIARAIVRGLRALGAAAEIVPVTLAPGPAPAFCFARAGSYEIEAGGRKLVGSAQRRQGPHFLQHGSILLGADASRLRAIFPTTADPLRHMTTLEATVGRRPAFDEVALAVRRGFEQEHGLVLEPGGLTAGERECADRLARRKYATPEHLAGTA